MSEPQTSRAHKPKPTSVLIELEPIFQENAPKALANTQLRRNMGKATQTIRGKRANVVNELSDWEALREAGRNDSRRSTKTHQCTNVPCGQGQTLTLCD